MEVQRHKKEKIEKLREITKVLVQQEAEQSAARFRIKVEEK